MYFSGLTIYMYRYLLIALLIFVTNSAIAAVFVVTSNADSGPGTLREALTLAAANGSAEKDYINFNLPDVSEAGRTITIESSLPNISSSLAIDGTTQPGVKFGVSDTKIIIQPSNTSDRYDPFLLTNVDGFEIYGLYIRDFIGIFPFEGSAVLFVNSCKNIQIGAPGKGNVFSNNAYVLASIYGHYYGNTIPPIFDGVENLTIYSNFFGFEPDGKSFRNRAYGYNATLDLSGCAGTIQIGGDNDNQRNCFGNAGMPIECRGTAPQTSHPTTFIIKNNFFNYNSDGSPAPLPNFNGGNLFTVRITDNEPYTSALILPYTVYLLNNKIQAPCGITVGTLTGDIVCQGNQVNKEASFNNVSFDAGGISFQSKKRVIIGGENPGEANTLYNAGIYAVSPVSVLIQRNSNYCINNGYDVVWQTSADLTPKLPVVAIGNIANSSISGTATPLSKVELFWDDDCQYCQPLTYITTVNVNADGNWTYSGNIQKGVIASATINGYTSMFTTGTAISGGKVIHSSCGKNDGSISGISFQYTGNYTWKNEQGQIIKQTPDIKDLSPGKYTLTAGNGTCSSYYTYEIFDATPQIVADQVRIVQPSCGTNNGSITYLYLNSTNYNVLQYDYAAYQYKWLDASNKIRSTSIDLTSVEAGTYRLEVTYNNNCPVTYGPITLKNTTGPNIDDSNPSITNTNCGQSTGSIKNIIVTGGSGIRHFTWKNSLQQEVAYTQDLTGQPAGTYTLHVTDDTQCGEVISSLFEIKADGAIIIDESAKTMQPATCEFNNGSITGMRATNATIYNWYNSDNQPVSNKPDLDNAAPGAYYLVASNANGCSAQSPIYTIERTPRTITGNTKIIKNASCGENNGGITIIFQQPSAPAPKSFRWVNHATGANVTITTAPDLQGLDAGVYDIYVTEQTGCEYLLASYPVARVDGLSVMVDNVQVEDDHCQTGTGSIKGINANGLTPLSFLWTDDNNNNVGSLPNLENVTAGTYHIQITDGSGCTQGLVYTVYDKSEIVTPPSVSDLDLCSAGNALLAVNDVSGEYSYRLYDNAAGTTPVNQQSNGRFVVNVTGNKSYYVSKLKGNCESALAEIKVKVGITALNIANAFTPNGDGHNDYWKIEGIENNPQAVVQVFDRYGQKLFESKGYAQPFNGTFKGKALPTGTYYYIINLNKNCNLLSGSVTIVR